MNYEEWKNLGFPLNVEGSLRIRDTDTTELPDNLNVSGFLDIAGSNFTRLPNNLTVGSYLRIRHTRITRLPDNLVLGSILFLPLNWAHRVRVGSIFGRCIEAVAIAGQIKIIAGGFIGNLAEFEEFVGAEHDEVEATGYISQAKKVFQSAEAELVGEVAS